MEDTKLTNDEIQELTEEIDEAFNFAGELFGYPPDDKTRFKALRLVTQWMRILLGRFASKEIVDAVKKADLELLFKWEQAYWDYHNHALKNFPNFEQVWEQLEPIDPIIRFRWFEANYWALVANKYPDFATWLVSVGKGGLINVHGLFAILELARRLREKKVSDAVIAYLEHREYGEWHPIPNATSKTSEDELIKWILYHPEVRNLPVRAFPQVVEPVPDEYTKTFRSEDILVKTLKVVEVLANLPKEKSRQDLIKNVLENSDSYTVRGLAFKVKIKFRILIKSPLLRKEGYMKNGQLRRIKLV
ncbi:MAG: hypothetical protein DRH11_13665 [Deltaproteobacteria bacterium]|nr:MAG: hypothetical protein DRH11_13665 [Deltaproteobacteria bacterium]